MPVSSRLRPALGVHLLRFIRIDSRQFDLPDLRIKIPSTVWDTRPRAFAAGIVQEVESIYTASAAPAPFATVWGLVRALPSGPRLVTNITHFGPSRAAQFDICYTSSDDCQTRRSRLVNLSLAFASDSLGIFLGRRRPFPASSDLVLDLRRIDMEVPPSAMIIHLRTLVASPINSDEFWNPAVIVAAKIQVSSTEVAKVIEEALIASNKHDRKKRCHIIKT